MISPSSRRSRSVGCWQYDALPPISMPPTGRRPSALDDAVDLGRPAAMADADELDDADPGPGCVFRLRRRGNHVEARLGDRAGEARRRGRTAEPASRLTVATSEATSYGRDGGRGKVTRRVLLDVAEAWRGLRRLRAAAGLAGRGRLGGARAFWSRWSFFLATLPRSAASSALAQASGCVLA